MAEGVRPPTLSFLKGMFRIKIVTPTNDCHYFYEEVKETALEAVQEFTKELEGLDCSIFLYKETKYGHIRIL